MGVLTGKLAIVTGAGSGIGRAVCKLFAQEGSKVVAADQNVKAAADTVATLQGLDHFPLELDVRDPDKISKGFDTIQKKFLTTPTIVVNSAGISKSGYILNLTDADFDDVIKVNLNGTFYVIRCAVKAMIASGISKGGSIINISSILARTGQPGGSNYSASKAGVLALTKSAGLEFGDFGVRVNAILPGLIHTPLIDALPTEIIQKYIQQSPLKRAGQPEEVAELTLFLASTKSSLINGSSIEICGGPITI